MLRELTNRSRRKWVVGGALAFGSVALLSTGFATWVIGANQTYADGEMSVTVDTATNTTSIVAADVLEGALAVAETGDATSNKYFNFAPNSGEGALVQDFSVKLSISVTMGNEAYAAAEETRNYVYIGMPVGLEQNNKFKAGEDKIDTVRSTNDTTAAAFRTGSSWSYLKFAEDTAYTLEANANSVTGNEVKVTFGENDWNTDSGLHVATKEVTVKFTWADFFGDMTPSAFYSAKLDNILDAHLLGGSTAGTAKYAAYVNAVATEFAAMETNLTGSFKLRVSNASTVAVG